MKITEWTLYGERRHCWPIVKPEYIGARLAHPETEERTGKRVQGKRGQESVSKVPVAAIQLYLLPGEPAEGGLQRSAVSSCAWDETLSLKERFRRGIHKRAAGLSPC